MAKPALPRVLFGTSALGNLFVEPTHDEKKAVVEQVLKAVPTALFDSAGKYGAGLALEELGRCLEELGVEPEQVLISNKLGWKRVPLTTPEPTFEPGAWVNLKNDAVQAISYDGIMECYRQGNALLGKYEARIVSVHDPDEYLGAAADEADLEARRADVLGAYRALAELKVPSYSRELRPRYSRATVEIQPSIRPETAPRRLQTVSPSAPRHRPPLFTGPCTL